jgi:putative membrane protein
MNADRGFRLPTGALIAGVLHHLPAAGGLLVAGLLYATRPELWPGQWALVVIAPLLALRVATPVLTWLTLRYAIEDREVSLVTGVLARRTRTIAWENIRVVDVERPWSYRLFGLAIASLRSGGSDDTVLTIPGIDERLAEEASRRAGQAAPLRTGVPDAAAPGGTDREVYRASTSALLIASLAYGQFAVVGAGIAAAAYDLLESLGFAEATLALFYAGPVIAGVACGLIVVLLGFVLTLVRFWAFTVSRRGDELRLTYGLFSRRERVIRPDAIIGARARRNLVEMCLDRVRVSLLTTDSAEGLGTNLVLPSLPRTSVSAILSPDLSAAVPHALLSRSGRRRIGPALLAALVLLVPPTALVVLLNPVVTPGWALAVGLGVLGALALGVRTCSTRLSFDGLRVARRMQHIAEQEDAVLVRQVHLASSIRASFVRSIRFVSVHFFAGTPRTLRAWTRDPDLARLIAEAIETVPRTPHTAPSRKDRVAA